MSYLDVFHIQLPVYEHDLSPGDVVALGENAGPFYEVLLVRAGMAWVRSVTQGSDTLVSVQRCRRISPTPTDTRH
jgi:hypothetical protein